MPFVRRFLQKNIDNMIMDPLYETLFADVKDGEVFPAVRKDELHFYHGGGCLFKFSGNSFKRNKAYKEYETYEKEAEKEKGYVAQDAYGGNFLERYEEFKKGNQKRFDKKGNGVQERKFLEEYYGETYRDKDFPVCCVLDIEVRINNEGKPDKCDMVLFNSNANEIMFVEGKIFRDSRLSCSGKGPEVINQVAKYTNQIIAGRQNIERQYCEYLHVMSQLFFGKAWEKKALKLITPAKLVVFETPPDPERRKELETKLRNKNINTLWIDEGKHKDFAIEDIWSRLT